MANNKQFSVMVDSGGILSYPQNFIAANSLAKFGSDVNGILNSLTTTRIEAESKTFGTATECIAFTTTEMSGSEYIDGKISFFAGEDSGIYSETSPLLSISKYETSIYSNNVISLQSGSDYSNNTRISVKPTELSLEYIKYSLAQFQSIVLKDEGIDLGVGYSYFDENSGSDKTIKNNILINTDKITVSAPLVELPANTTIGGKSVATGVSDNMVTTDTEQTITGKKTFTGAVNINSSSPVVIESATGTNIYGAEGLSLSDSYSNSIGLNSTTGISITGNNYVDIYNTISGNIDSQLLLEDGLAKLSSTASYFSANMCDATVWAGEQVFITAENTEIGAINMSAPSYISLKSNEVVIGKDDNSSIRLKGSIDTTYSTAVVTTIGTSETSSKLPTEGAIVKALKNVSGGSTPDLSNYLKKSGDTTLTLGEQYVASGTLTVNKDDGDVYTTATGGTVIVKDSSLGTTTIRGGELYLDHESGVKLTINDSGIAGSVIDTTIPETPVAGHIATTGAIKTYVDNKVASGGTSFNYIKETTDEVKITSDNTSIFSDGKVIISTPSISLSAANGEYNSLSLFSDGDIKFTARDGVYFNATLGVGKLVSWDNLNNGDATTSYINVGHNTTEIVDKNDGIVIDGHTQFGRGNDIIMSIDNGSEPSVIFEKPMKLQIYNTSTKKWTYTYKYTYLTQDEAGSVSLAIADSYPQSLPDNISSFTVQNYLPSSGTIDISLDSGNSMKNSPLNFTIISPDGVGIANSFFIELEPINETVWQNSDNNNPIRAYLTSVTRDKQDSNFIYDWSSTIRYRISNNIVYFYSSDFNNANIMARLPDMIAPTIVMNLKYGYSNGIEDTYFITIPIKITWSAE